MNPELCPSTFTGASSPEGSEEMALGCILSMRVFEGSLGDLNAQVAFHGHLTSLSNLSNTAHWNQSAFQTLFLKKRG